MTRDKRLAKLEQEQKNKPPIVWPHCSLYGDLLAYEQWFIKNNPAYDFKEFLIHKKFLEASRNNALEHAPMKKGYEKAVNIIIAKYNLPPVIDDGSNGWD